jgi:hypothetical protein
MSSGITNHFINDAYKHLIKLNSYKDIIKLNSDKTPIPVKRR